MGEPQRWFTRAFRDRATEQAYLDETARRVRRSYRILTIFAFVVYVLFNHVESLMTRQVVWLGSQGNIDALMMLRSRVGLPLAAAVTAFGFAPLPLFRRWWATVTVLGGGSLGLVPLASVHWMPEPHLVNLGISSLSVTTVIVTICLVLPVRFVNALLLVAGSVVVSVINARYALSGMRDLAPTYFWFFFAMVLALVGALQVEQQDRRAFLQGRAAERERARADVAERSREMSEALLKLAGAPPAPRTQSGDVIAERYRVLRLLGAGGMGEVHEVERLGDGRRLALKLLTGASDHEALLRFAREARIAAEIVHPNIVGVFDVGVAARGMFLVMELVEGTTLAAQKARYGQLEWALPILRQIAAAICAMHKKGIIHRDLKPSNVLLDGERVKVADFGIASLGEGAASTMSLTATGVMMGTPLYMAPELERGARGASPSSDLYSLGVVAYELLAGKLPHALAPVLERAAGRVPVPPTPLSELRPELPPELVKLIARCLADAPEARPTAEEAVRIL